MWFITATILYLHLQILWLRQGPMQPPVAFFLVRKDHSFVLRSKPHALVLLRKVWAVCLQILDTESGYAQLQHHMWIHVTKLCSILKMPWSNYELKLLGKIQEVGKWRIGEGGELTIVRKSMLQVAWFWFFFYLSLRLYVLFCLLGLLATVPSNPNGNGNGGLMSYSPGESISGCGSTGGQSNPFNMQNYWN